MSMKQQNNYQSNINTPTNQRGNLQFSTFDRCPYTNVQFFSYLSDEQQ